MNVPEFADLLKDKCQLAMDQPVIAGISGGPDSLCLLDLLIRSGLNVIAVHINHQLRSEADLEACAVTEFCERNGIRCVIGKLDVSAYAKEKKLSIEESARILRYQFLYEQAAEHQAQAVLVAHNADDQAETVIMHLLRGSGSSGLKGMEMRSFQPQWSDRIPLIRPLLGSSREEILTYCDERRLLPVYDQSNNDTKYFRNRIRRQLLPELMTYNPRIKERLTNLSDVIGYEDDLITQHTAKAWQEVVTKEGKSYVQFSKSRLTALHPALLRRILRRAIQLVAPTLRDIDFGVIKRASEFLYQDRNTNHLLLLAEVEVIKYRHSEVLICERGNPMSDLWPYFAHEKKLLLNRSGITPLGAGWQIECGEGNSAPPITKDRMICSLDALKIDAPFLDMFHPGDRFTPYGLNGNEIKVGDYWTKQGLPERARKHWPIIRNGNGEIIWVAGFQISENFKITPQTEKFLGMRLSYLKEEN